MSDAQSATTDGHAPAKGDGKRTTTRRRTLLGGRVFDDEGRIEDCTISDISVAGVRIRVGYHFPNATQLTLRMDRFGEILRAAIMWRRGGQIGLQFLKPFTAIPPAMAAIFKLLKEKDKQGAA